MEIPPGPLSGRRRWSIAAVKGVHTVIFAIEAASVVHIFAAGLLNRPSRWTRFALAATLSEVALMVATRWRCPLTDLAEWLGAAGYPTSSCRAGSRIGSRGSSRRCCLPVSLVSPGTD